MPRDVRFWPPHVPLAPDVHWALLRAFAPLAHEIAEPPAPLDAVTTATRLGLLPRIITRQPRDLLRSELGPVLEDATQRVHLVVARGLALERALHVVHDASRSVGARYALIKGAAVVRHLGTNLGLRGSCDLDLLLNESDAQLLHQQLLQSGYSVKTPSHPFFHLPTLMAADGTAIEIHTELPFIHVDDQWNTAKLRDLLAQGLVGPVSGAFSCAYLPTLEFILAHCIAHGIAQHGYAPHSYPLMRMLADVVDITQLRPNVNLDHVRNWIAPIVSDEEIQAVIAVSTALHQGQGRAIWNESGGNARLLRHLVIGTLDARYANGLKLLDALQRLQTFGLRPFLRKYGTATFALANADVVRIYGTSATGKERWIKLGRPFDMIRRTLRVLPDTGAELARRIRRG